MQIEWPAWRLVIEGTAALSEVSGVNASYSLADVYKANALLDMRADIEAANRPKEPRK